MYPLTHVYFAQKVLGYIDDATTLGSMFPDMVILCGIPWDGSHRLGITLWPHLKNASGPIIPFVKGIITHGIEPRGLDYYSDEQYSIFEKGYCFEKARPLVKQVVEALNIPPENGWWKAHNFIEMGIELYMDDRHSWLQRQVFQAFQNKYLIDRLVSDLSPLLPQRNRPLDHCFSIFENATTQGEISAALLAARYEKQINHRHNIDSIDILHCQALIEEGRRIIEAEVEEFFEDVKQRIVPVWDEYASK